MSGFRGSVATAGRTPERLDVAAGRYGFWSFRNVAINVWLQPPEVIAVERLIGLTRHMIAANPGGFSAVHYVPGGMALPTGDARQALVRLSSASDHGIACVGVVLAGGGFWASTVRSAVTGIQILARVEFSIRIAASVAELLTWFPRGHLAQTGVSVPPEQLESAIHYAINETEAR